MRNLRTGCERRSPLETSWGQAVWSGSDDDSRPARLRLNQRLPRRGYCQPTRSRPEGKGNSELRHSQGMTQGENYSELLMRLSMALAMTEAAFVEAKRRRNA